MKYLGVDWGLKRVGVAFSEGDIASPWQSLTIAGLKDGAEKIGRLVKEKDIDCLVIGKPEGEMGKRVDDAVKVLVKLAVEVVVVDETLSTHEAKGMMLKMGYGKKARMDDDATAAAIILQNYLDEI